VTNLSLFDAAPIMDVQPTATPSRIDGVVRLISAKPGAFRELRNGEPTGREFYLAELEDGRIVWQFIDNGQQCEAPAAMTRVLIDDAIRYGVFVEVTA
jgi:hypothetical protein